MQELMQNISLKLGEILFRIANNIMFIIGYSVGQLRSLNQFMKILIETMLEGYTHSDLCQN